MAVVNPTGLSSAEARSRLERDGPNEPVPESRSGRWRRRLGPLLDPMVLLLLVAAPTYVAIGETTDAVVALVALVPVALVGWALETRAERTLAQLERLTAPRATVVRDGAEVEVEARDLVVGDLVRVREGDIVPADAEVTVSSQISLDEAALTGESFPVAKRIGADARLFAGTTVVSGEAYAVVTATGRATRYGTIGLLVDDAATPRTPLQQALGRLVVSLALVAVVVCVAVVVAELLHGRGWGEAILAAVSLAIAAIPEEFSMVYALYLALGAWRLAQDRALVRRLPSVETLGSTTVICTDKTGTLTEGRLSVHRIWTPAGGIESLTAPSPDARDLVRTALLASEITAFDPLDIAVVDAARFLDIERDAGDLVVDHPFDPADRYVTHVWRRGDTVDVAAKGALEGLSVHASVDPSIAAALGAANDAFTADGMRVIAVAAGSSTETGTTRADHEESLTLIGLIAFSDPIRVGVADALATCREAGIRVVMMTGDHPATARAIATELSLGDRGDALTVLTGDELDRTDDDALGELVRTTDVFARIRPEQKHRLVQHLRRDGDVVAMTGDGINDAPALRVADIGVAMGRRGTEVARSAAAVVLLDDDFTTIVHAVRDGRRIVDNLVAAFGYLVAFHPPLVLAALVMPLFGQPLLLLPVHFVALELLLHPIVSLVFQADPARDDSMRRPPRRMDRVFALRSFADPYALGAVMAAAVIAVYLVALGPWTVDQARAVAFVSLLASQPALMLGARSPSVPFWRGPRPTSTLAVVCLVVIAFAMATVTVGPLSDLLHMEPFPATGWPVVLAVALLPVGLEPLKARRGWGQRVAPSTDARIGSTIPASTSAATMRRRR